VSLESSTRLRRAAPVTELCIVVECHTFVGAIPVRYVTRLVLNEDVTPVPQFGAEFVQSGGDLFVASNLGALLELPALGSAWVLLHVPHAGGRVPIALQTGTCVAVREVCVEAPLPAGLFRARGAAVLGAFVADASRGFGGSTLYGLVLDLTKLWSRAELDISARLIARHRQQKADG